jgi:hypothetical protein
VVGVSGRSRGASDSDETVLTLPLRRVSLGVPIRSSLCRTAADRGVSGAVTVSADGSTAETESAGFTWTGDGACDFSVAGSGEEILLLLLRGLNNPPIPPRTPDSPPPPDVADSLDFLRLRANPALNLSAGDELASRLRLRFVAPLVGGIVSGSMI